ncbi:MAG TPA: VapC toxin family PIN domain ribonuclease [Thermoanaerobaculia bacterium]
MILIDTSGLLTWIDASQNLHREVSAAMKSVAGPYILSPFILAELDYLIATRVGTAAELALLDEVARGAYRLEPFAPSDVQRARLVLEKFRDLDVGLADASIVVLAERYRVRDVLTLDTRHFRSLRTLDGQPFRLIPADV